MRSERRESPEPDPPTAELCSVQSGSDGSEMFPEVCHLQRESKIAFTMELSETDSMRGQSIS